MSQEKKDHHDLELALQKGLTEVYGGNFRVVIKKIKSDHQDNPFCLIYPIDLVIYGRNNRPLNGDAGPQQDLFQPETPSTE